VESDGQETGLGRYAVLSGGFRQLQAAAASLRADSKHGQQAVAEM